MTTNRTESDTDAHSKVTQIFEFLKAFASLRHSTVLQITDHPWWQWLSQLPEHESISITGEDEIKEWLIPSLEQEDEKDEGDETGSVSGTYIEEKEEVIFRVRRPDVLPPPGVPDVLSGWLEEGWNDPSRAASYVLGKESSTEFTSDENLTPPQEYFDDDPVRVQEWESWVVLRNAWAETQLAAHRANQIYERLFALHRELEREPETFELMIGDGFLVGRTKTNQIVEHPIILQSVTLRFDSTVPEFRVIQSDASPGAHEPALQALGATSSVIRKISQRIATGDIHPLLRSDTDEFLINTVSEISADGEFTGNGRPIGDHNGVRIGREPVLFQRRRSAGYARAIDNILEALDLDLCITDPLKRLVGEFQTPTDSDSSEFLNNSLDDLFLTKPANRQQQEIIRLLDRGDQVVVQGPPGTGKTHTIGNVLGHLLEQGKRVLVTSHTTKALEEVRDSVVEDLRPLCVSMLGSEMRHKAELEQAVDHITARLTQVQESEARQKIDELFERREDRLISRRQTLERLVHAIGDESRPIKCEGQEWTPIDAAKYLRSRMDADGWIPGSPNLDKALPLSPHEIGELYHTNLTVPVEYQGDLQSALPAPETLLDPEEFKSLISEYSERSGLELESYKVFWDLETDRVTDSEYLSDVLGRFKSATEPLRTYPTGTWQDEILSIGRGAGLPLNEGGVPQSVFDRWRELTEMVEHLASLHGEAQASSLQYDTHVPAEYANSDGLETLEQILEHLRSGNKLGRFTLLTHGMWNRTIKQCRVNGRIPETEEEFDALCRSTSFKVETEKVFSRWRRHTTDGKFASLDIEGSNNQLSLALEFGRQIDTLLNWHREKWNPIERELAGIGFNLPRFTGATIKSEFLDFSTFKNFVSTSLLNAIEMEYFRVRQEFIESTLNKTLGLVQETTSDLNNESILGRLKNAIIQKDEEAYSSSYATLVDVYSKVSAYMTRRDLLDRLSEVAPEWADAVQEREGVHSSHTPPGNPDEAWLWVKLNAEIESRLKESIPDLQATVEGLDADLTDITAQLVDEKTWLSLKERLSDSQLQSLSGWRRLQARIGKGTGIRAPAFKRQARQLMRQCQSAVPVWIMPLTTLVENFDPAVSHFDCLIVDEASQVDVMGLIPFSMADQVLVVGDDQQVSPEDVGRAQQPVDDLIRQYLIDIPSSALYDGRASIYELADISFRNVIRLTDHFRCVEPIIKFSSDLCYNGELDCLRDSSSVTVGPPTLDLNVRGVYDRDVNEQEAVNIASLMIACDEQPEYAGLTFGMVSMLSGSRQHQRVDELLMRHLSPTAYENRKILCGIPAHFQGGERDVMFISLVTSPRIDGTPLPRMGFGARDINKKRFNVAASRARDQMWVIHSLEPNYDLRGYEEDLRSRLILHARTASSLESKLGRLQAKTRSPFEIAVGERLLSAGYEVEPAWMVGKLEIDLVVLGEGNRKLAIECDGEAFHPPSKLMEDLSRERILEIIGKWRFQRIRGSAFYRDPEIAMKPIFERLSREGIFPGSKDNTEPSEQEESDRLLRLQIEGRARELRQEWDSDDYSAPEPASPETDPSDPPNSVVQDVPSQEKSQLELPNQVATLPEDVSDSGQVIAKPDTNLLKPYSRVDLAEFARTATLAGATPNLLVPMMVEIAKVEGPVHREVLLKRVREKFALGRLTGSTREHIVRVLSGAVSAGSILRMGDYYVVDSVQAANPPRNRGDREIDQIFERELSSVMKSIRNDRPRLTREQILREVANRFGYQRISEKVRSILDRLLDELGF